jgi:hypothetical protein
LSEMGTLGALALAALVLCFVLNGLEVGRFYRQHPEVPRDFVFHVSRAIGLIVVLLLLLGWSGHTLYRYNWQWFAAFQAIAVHCVRQNRGSWFVDRGSTKCDNRDLVFAIHEPRFSMHEFGS